VHQAFPVTDWCTQRSR